MIHSLKKTVKAFVFALIFVGVALGVSAAVDDPAAVVKYRLFLMQAQTFHLRAIAAVVRGEVSYGAHVKDHADAIKDIAAMEADIFPEGSIVAGSRAKPEIWQNWDEFQRLYVDYKIQAEKLAEVAATGDLSAIGSQLQEVGKTCGACHKPFRTPKQ